MSQLKILFAASECFPLAKSGGLGDVIGALPKAFPNKQADVRIILPKYGSIPQPLLKSFKLIDHFSVDLGIKEEYVGIFKGKIDNITIYLIDNEYYFNRRNLYGDYDDGERFIYFSRAVLEALPYMDFYPDVIHCHDWQTALIPFLLKEQYHKHYTHTKSIFTIHNMKYQGVYSYGDVAHLLKLDHFPESMEYYGNLNWMKGALYAADFVTTVSPSYGEEIKDPYYGEGLEGVIKDIAYKEVGILNGIDKSEYNPQNDQNIFVNYTRSYSKKQENKVALQEHLSLPNEPEVPVIAMIGRLVEQKGLDLVSEVVHEILQMDVQLVVLGTGDEDYERLIRDVGYAYPDKVSAIINFDESLARKIYAGSDMFLMPSKFEPCGLSQLIALRYGSIPIVRETGGLRDTVKFYNKTTKSGNGFSFYSYNAHDMLFTIQKAVELYQNNPEDWIQLFQNAVKCNFDWKSSAESYLYYYKKVCGLLI